MTPEQFLGNVLMDIRAKVSDLGGVAYDGMGPFKAHDIASYNRAMIKMTDKEAAQVLHGLFDAPVVRNRGKILAATLAEELEDWEDLMSLPGIQELRNWEF